MIQLPGLVFPVLNVLDGVTALEFSVDSSYLVSAGDKHINVFYNVVGYRGTIAELEEKKKAATTQALRERLQQQIDEAEYVSCSVGRGLS